MTTRWIIALIGAKGEAHAGKTAPLLDNVDEDRRPSVLASSEGARYEGVEYEVVKGPVSRSKRDEIVALSGQRLYPVIEFEDGSVYRDQSKKMAERIQAGKLFESPTNAQGATE